MKILASYDVDPEMDPKLLPLNQKMLKKVAILQSNYIPWKGYFDLIQSVNTFVIYDRVQFTKNDWRNRNKLIINGKANWITVPVLHKNLAQTIEETTVANPKWASKHWKTIEQAYSKARYFKIYAERLKETYIQLSTETHLSKINMALIMLICDFLDIRTEIITDNRFDLPENRVDKLVTICKETGASTYVSGPAAKSYIDEERFHESGINLEWMDYSHYPQYDQISTEFDHFVSVLDLLFCYGPDFQGYIRGEK